MDEKRVSIVRDPQWGYRRLDPLPTEHQLGEFYESQYYELLRKGGRAPELRRLSSDDGEEASQERAWLHRTLYADIAETLDSQVPGGSVLDVGCGTGEFMSFLRGKGFVVTGTEPSKEASESARSLGLNVHTMSLDEYGAKHQSENLPAFDAIVLLNVLEHVPRPAELLQASRSLLGPKGIICVRVPNDFNDLQSAAESSIEPSGWWITAPDHVNYFDFPSLRSLFEQLQMDVVHEHTDFPMELFLLMGDNYVSSPAVGESCHQRRVQLETALPDDLRRRIYGAFARAGLGRNCLTFAQRRAA